MKVYLTLFLTCAAIGILTRTNKNRSISADIQSLKVAQIFKKTVLFISYKLTVCDVVIKEARIDLPVLTVGRMNEQVNE